MPTWSTPIWSLLESALSLGWPLWLAIVIVVMARTLALLFRRPRARGEMDQIDVMDGRAFEERLELLFRKMGFQVERTRYTGDYGGDLVAVHDDIRTVVQAKRTRGTVGVKAVQEAVAARGYYRCDHAMVITNGYFTEHAIALAEANDVGLWDREHLIVAILGGR